MKKSNKEEQQRTKARKGMVKLARRKKVLDITKEEYSEILDVDDEKDKRLTDVYRPCREQKDKMVGGLGEMNTEMLFMTAEEIAEAEGRGELKVDKVEEGGMSKAEKKILTVIVVCFLIFIAIVLNL